MPMKACFMKIKAVQKWNSYILKVGQRSYLNQNRFQYEEKEYKQYFDSNVQIYTDGVDESEVVGLHLCLELL